MSRRQFIMLVGGVAASWPVVAHTQQGAMPVIGFLSSLAANGFGVYLEAFREGLKDTGYSEGRNVQIEYRRAEGQYDQLPGLAADLVSRHVSVIFTAGGNPPVQAAKSTTVRVASTSARSSAAPNLPICRCGDRPSSNSLSI
jgi:ABC-type uncharacterized transport system substrate-binding protein